MAADIWKDGRKKEHDEGAKSYSSFQRVSIFPISKIADHNDYCALRHNRSPLKIPPRYDSRSHRDGRVRRQRACRSRCQYTPRKTSYHIPNTRNDRSPFQAQTDLILFEARTQKCNYKRRLSDTNVHTKDTVWRPCFHCPSLTSSLHYKENILNNLFNLFFNKCECDLRGRHNRV